ncbi:MAG TPA: hypothetical protein VFY39_16330 [Gammaproteobacteria bacterium]|nr:hypothetical protein [Gammaproteobacteria bacterium]
MATVQALSRTEALPGFAVSYTAGLVIPGLYSFWLLGLSYLLPYQYTALVLVALGGVLVFVASWIGPETRDVAMQ